MSICQHDCANCGRPESLSNLLCDACLDVEGIEKRKERLVLAEAVCEKVAITCNECDCQNKIDWITGEIHPCEHDLAELEALKLWQAHKETDVE